MLWYNIQFSLWCPMYQWGQAPPMQPAAATPPPQNYPFWNPPFQMPPYAKRPPWGFPSGQMPQQMMQFPNLPFWNPFTPTNTTTPPTRTSTLANPGGQVPFYPIQFPHPWGFTMPPPPPPGGDFPVKPKMPPFGAGYPFSHQYNVPPMFPFPSHPAKPNNPPMKFPINFPPYGNFPMQMQYP